MPRRNQSNRRRRHVPPQLKGKGMKRPSSWHRGPQRDEHFAEANRRLREAENGWGEAAA